MQLTFLTGNQGKLKEFQAFLPDIKSLDIDLPEIQEIDAHAIIRAKLKEALQHHKGNFIVEDTSLYIKSLKGLPGPLIKWFLKTIDVEGVYKMAEATGDVSAQAKTVIGLSGKNGKMHFFEGVIEGKIVAPRGSNGFGWDAIFEPAGHDKTFAEMDATEKNQVSMRQIAVQKLQLFIVQEQQ